MEKAQYRATSVDAAFAQSRKLSPVDWKVLGVVMTIATAVRLYGLAWPASVVFDEVHFGGFARKYVIGRFFFDVHPPLAKMLIAVAAWFGGYDGEFEFKNIGDDYISAGVPYVAIRMLPALMGLGTIALSFSTLRASGCRTYVAAAAALLLTFENTHATESRYILLDSPLVFFIALSTFGFKKFETDVPFTSDWWRHLLLTGVSLGATVSSKWVGLFTIAWVGCLTIYQLWWIWGDLSITPRRFLQHFGARALCLILVPVTFYVGMFYLHFFCVDNYGEGAEFLPRAFQATLKHNDLPTNIPAEVGYGSIVSIRHLDTAGGWLHSHIQQYETGSKQQQVTLYPHADENNLWRIENGTTAYQPNEDGSPVWVKDGDVIRLEHVTTEKRLHSHDHRAPVTSHDYINEVSGYGFPGFEGDYNDNWRVKIVGKESIGEEAKHRIRALRTYFQLEHTMTGCLLYSKNVRLPDWGFDQQEVSCIKNGKLHNTVWYVEHNENPLLPEMERVDYKKPGFFQNFLELQKVMWNVNKGLTEPHNWETRPLQWLTLRRGINMWGDSSHQVYLVGNLPIYLSIAIGVGILVAYKIIALLLWQRRGGALAANNSYAPKTQVWGIFDHNFGNYILGWWLHYFPSFLMERQLFLHHYLGSLYFGVLALGQALELGVSTIKCRYLAMALPALAVLVAGTWYVWYSPLIYGSSWTKSMCQSSVFGDMDWDCNLFPESYGDYTEANRKISESISYARQGLPVPTGDSSAEVFEANAVEEESPEKEQQPIGME